MKEKEYRDYDEGDGRAVGYALGVTLAFVTALLIGVMMLLLSGCTTTRYVPVETVRTEYKDKIVEKVTVDSVTDTRFVYVKGDTVIGWRERVKWKERVVHDSIYFERVDTIREPYPVERPLTRWEQTKMDLGGIAIGGLVVVIAIAVVWLIGKFRR